MSALKKQVAGDHYKKLGIQPVEITYANFGYDGIRTAIYTKVNKYLLREKGDLKEGLKKGTHRENLKKAIHCIEMQIEFLDKHEADQLSIIHNRRSMDQ
jgi:hypothetical protein